jgi:hypothetical protein
LECERKEIARKLEKGREREKEKEGVGMRWS